MVSARAATKTTVLHRVHGVATRVRVRVGRWGARGLEAKMRGHHRARREGNILLARAGSRALATAKVGNTGHGTKLLLLGRVEHHLLERPLGKLLLLLLVSGLLGEVALLTKLRLLGKVRVTVKGATGRGGRGMGPLELLLLLLLRVLVLRGKSVLVRGCEGLTRQSAFSSRGRNAG